MSLESTEKVRIVQNIINTMNRIGPLRLAAMAAMALGLIIFFVFVSSRLSSGQMKLLYNELSAQDRNAIVRELEAANIPYAVNDGSGEIQVGAKEVGRVRMLLAEKGLPEGGSVGYEIFDKDSSLGTTRFDQDMKQLRALEGELTRTVNTIKSIDSSRIHLVLPKRELFSRETRPATASVFVKLKPSRALDAEQVMAIQHLIAAAVPELNPKNVSIVDQAGNLLANGRNDTSESAATANVEKMRLAFEQKLMYQIQDMIAKIVGTGKVQVVVSADMDYDREITSAEQYDPEGQVARSTQSVEENENETQAQPNNVTVQNNLPGLPNEGAGEKDTRTTNRTEEITNFEVSKTIRNHTREGGVIRNLSVAVLVDGNYTPDQEGVVQYAPRSEQELNNIKSLVSSAIGYNEKRGDTLEVVNMPFVSGDNDTDFAASNTVFMGMDKDDIFRLAETGILGLVSILVVLLVLRPMAGKLLAPREAGAEGLSTANSEGMMLLDGEGKPMLAGPAGSTMMSNDFTGASMSINENGDEMMVDLAAVDGKIKASSVQKVNEIIDRYPNEAVSIVRSWMFQET